MHRVIFSANLHWPILIIRFRYDDSHVYTYGNCFIILILTQNWFNIWIVVTVIWKGWNWIAAWCSILHKTNQFLNDVYQILSLVVSLNCWWLQWYITNNNACACAYILSYYISISHSLRLFLFINHKTIEKTTCR